MAIVMLVLISLLLAPVHSMAEDVKNLFAYANTDYFRGADSWESKMATDIKEKEEMGLRNVADCDNYYCDLERFVVLTDNIVRNIEKKLGFSKKFGKRTTISAGRSEKKPLDIRKWNSLISGIKSGIKLEGFLNPKVRIEARIALSDHGEIVLDGDMDSAESRASIMYSVSTTFLDYE